MNKKRTEPTRRACPKRYVFCFLSVFSGVLAALVPQTRVMRLLIRPEKMFNLAADPAKIHLAVSI